MATKLTTRNKLDIAILEPRGTLIGGKETDDLVSACRDLLEQGNKKAVIDLENVTYINSSGIGVLVSIHSMYKRASGSVRLCNLSKNVENIFVITRLISVFEVDESQAASIKNLSQ